MILAPGTKLGPYEIVAPLGAGGMGEVYRGRDTRLERTVAIKVLAAGLVGRPETRKRFEREARALSGLSHPHICTLHDIGCQDGVDYLVMEYLEGETLALRLNKGPLPTEQVLRYGIEIADALEKAHRQNVVHRDLKPGNIMLTKAGANLLDFGLARLITQPLPGAEALTELTAKTRDQSLTEEGVILGTFQYMAPEQLEGKEADARADIFALGEVIYEMSTGKPAFSGKSRASLIAAILASEPPSMTEFQPLTPPALERVVKTCLAKDPDARWQSAQDLKLQLEWIRDAGSQAGVAPVVAKHRLNRERVAWIAASFLLVVAALFSIGYLRRAPAPPREMIFTVEPPPGYTISADGLAALSPDGAQLAYAAEDSKGKRSLWVRSVESLISRRLDGSESSNEYYSLVWTTDGSAVIAPVDAKLTRLSVSGGANEVLCEKFAGMPSTINRDGTILAWFAPPTKIVSISGDDCTPRPISSAVTPEPGVGYAYPHFLPDGKHFLFAAIRKDKHDDVLVGSLDGSAPRVVVRNASYPKYVASGHILFSRDGYLMAQRFDAESLRSNGEPFLAYPNQLNFYAAFGWAAFDASINAVISAKEQALAPSALRWYSRGGEVLQKIGEPDHRIAPRLTVQGTRAAVCFWDPRTHASDFWSVDLEGGAWRRESFLERPMGGGWAVWSSDGKQLIYSALIGADLEMFVKKAGSSDNGQIFQTGLTGTKIIGDWSADGKSIVYLFESDTSGVSIYGQLLGGRKPFLLGRAGPEEEPPRLSPDGRWVAYQSSESGFSEIYVRPFTADAAASVQVSSGGGHDPRWSRAGNELFYRTNDWRLISVPLSQGKQLRFGKPFTLFHLPQNAEYDAFDGKRFLVNEPVGITSEPLFMIINWKAERRSRSSSNFPF